MATFYSCLLWGKDPFVHVHFRGQLEENSVMYLFPFASSLLERLIDLLALFLLPSFICSHEGIAAESLQGYGLITTIFLDFILDQLEDL